MEYLLVVGFSLVIVVPTVALLYHEYDQNRTQVRVEHLTELSREIAFQAEKMYYQGSPSRVTVEAYFPPGIEVFEVTDYDPLTTITDAHTVLFKLASTDVSIYADTKINIKEIRFEKPFSGKHYLTISVNPGADPRAVTDDYIEISDADMVSVP